MSNKLSNPNRVSFDPGPVDVEAFDNWAEQQDMSRSEALRKLMQRVTDDTDESPVDDPDLRKCYRVLSGIAVNNRVPTDKAKSALSEELKVDKKFAKRYLRRLEQHGVIEPAFGVVILRA